MRSARTCEHHDSLLQCIDRYSRTESPPAAAAAAAAATAAAAAAALTAPGANLTRRSDPAKFAHSGRPTANARGERIGTEYLGAQRRMME